MVLVFELKSVSVLLCYSLGSGTLFGVCNVFWVWCTFECAMCSGFGVLLSVQCVLGLVYFECAVCSGFGVLLSVQCVLGLVYF